jgi:O-antigen ligase
VSRMMDTTDSAKECRRRSQEKEADAPVARVFLWLTDLALAGVIFLAPLFMGGRHEIGRLVYVLCVSAAAISCLGRLCWSRKQRWRLTGAEPLMIAGVILLAVQLVPLPTTVIETISSELVRLLPVWSAAADSPVTLGTWNQLSLTPRNTQGGLVTFLAHCLLFLVVIQRIRDRSDLERLLRWLALAAIGMAALGLVQLLFGNGKFLWLYEHPERSTFGAVRGSFANQNHLAHFLILGLGPIFWWLQRLWAAGPTSAGPSVTGGSAQYAKPALLIGTGLVLVAILLTFSRGGVVTACIASLVILVLMTRNGLLKQNAWLSIAGLSVVLIGALAIYGYEPLARRMVTLRDSRSLDEVCHGRKALWEAHLEAIPRFLATGTGAGSHREIYQTYMSESFDTEFSHGENGYLHLLLEMGIVGLILALAALSLATFWCLRVCFRPADQTLGSAAIAAMAGILASAVHSLGDFVWYIPACLSLTVILAACGCRIYQLNRFKLSLTSPDGIIWRPRQLVCPTPVAITATISALLLSTMMVGDRIPSALAAPHWDAYYRLSLAEQQVRPDELGSCGESTMTMLEHLRQVLLRDPHHGRAHLRLARLSLREFDRRHGQSDNPMPLSQIRDAALASQFDTSESRDNWLSAVLSENRLWLDLAHWHTRQALLQCPLFGDGYVYLAELGFLQGDDAEAKHAFIQQALTVQPYSGVVLVSAGSEAALAGDADQALELWKRAFHQDRHQRRQIIEMLAAEMPATDFVEHFQPGTDGLAQLFSYYRRQNLGAQALQMADAYANSLQADAERLGGEQGSRSWIQAASVHEFAGNLENFLSAARYAVLLAPNDFDNRRLLIRALLKNEAYAEAVEQLQWCISRQPDDPRLQDQLQRVYRQQLTYRQAKN